MTSINQKPKTITRLLALFFFLSFFTTVNAQNKLLPVFQNSFSTCCTNCNFTLDVTPIDCIGSYGSITVISSCNDPCQYSIDNGQTWITSNVFVNVPPGTYTVLAGDISCNQPIGTISMLDPVPLILFTNVNPTTSCTAYCYSGITTQVTGGTPPYTYVWSNGETTPNVTNLCDGVYELTVADQNGCIAADVITIANTNTSGLTIDLVGTAPTSCANICDGIIDAVVTGGVAPYSFQWSTGETTGVLTSLCAGTYAVVVTDANGCFGSSAITLVDPNNQGLTVGLIGTAPTSCTNICDGIIDVVVTGGVAPFSYQWSTGATTGALTNLCAGTYAVTVTDANGCLGFEQIWLSADSSGFAIENIFVENVSCNGDCNGVASMVVSGGVPPYTYLWTGGGTGATESGLCPGTYLACAWDSNGCYVSQNVIITEPAVLEAIININEPTSCSTICDGVIGVQAIGGTAPYQYQWSNGSNLPSIDNLCAGIYTVTITDANGCLLVDQITLSGGNSSLQITGFNTTNVSCSGSCDGSATMLISGGTPPYTYLWTGGGGTGVTASGLCAGTYLACVWDSNGCYDAEYVTITEPPLLTLATTSVPASCGNNCDGIIYATATGGTPPLVFDWSNGATTNSVSNLCPGTYALTVTDANGCVATTSQTVFGGTGGNSTLHIDSLIVNNQACAGSCNGSVTAYPSGGLPPYYYEWSTGATTQTATGVCADTIHVTITDSSGCGEEIACIIVEETTGNLQSTVIELSGSCSTFCDGMLLVNVVGGTPPYTYQWSDGQVQDVAFDLCPGTYTVTITDANGCTTVDYGFIWQSAPLNIQIDTLNDASCEWICDGSASISIYGGTAPYQIVWSDGSTGAYADNLCHGSHAITVTDANGCIEIFTLNIGAKYQFKTQVSAIVTTEQMVVYPNPAIDVAILRLPIIEEDVIFSLQVINALGVPVLQKQYESRSNSTVQLDVQHLPTGNYWVVLSYNNQQMRTSIFITK